MSELTSMSTEMRSAPAVLITHGRSQDVEDYVRALARRSGQPCDWGFVAGRAVVHTTGDLVAVADAARALRWMEAAMQCVSAGEDFLQRHDRFAERVAGPPHFCEVG